MGEKRKISLKMRIIGIMMLCWLLPLILIVGINLHYIWGSHFDAVVSRQLTQLKFNDQVSVERLNKVIQSSRKASYDGTIVALMAKYNRLEIPERKLIQSTNSYLSGQYGRDESIKAAILWYKSDPEHLNSNTYNQSVNGVYPQVSNYWKEDHQKIAEFADTLGTSAGFYVSGKRCYLVRNLLNASYHEIATLVMLLNQDYCFESYASFPTETSVTLQLDEGKLDIQGETVEIDEKEMEEIGGKAGYIWENGKLCMYHKIAGGEYNLTVMVRIDDNPSLNVFYGYRPLIAGMILCLVPLLLILFKVFEIHMSRPMNVLMKGAKEIEEGNLGYQLEQGTTGREFQYLTESFNQMSSKLKYQFDHIYEEELALRDARIMALQSHINPHFMNNTLEIINWEARLSGNQKVSMMIEALSTLMDATIDRKKQPIVLLSEEMIYVDAYLYIIAERLGKRVSIKKELPPEIMQYEVPRLILQPLIENAVEHGVVRNGQGTILITGYAQEEYLYLEIVNDATLTKAEEERMERLLDVNYDTSKESSGNMGIANVNQRLRIIYGEPCGLSIQKDGPDHVRARLTIRISPTSC
ncbi:MAG: histidine kinase [Lachnospiraceae bacterium]|nr:histidine kinase [Lachnospiraceae bacterium]